MLNNLYRKSMLVLALIVTFGFPWIGLYLSRDGLPHINPPIFPPWELIDVKPGFSLAYFLFGCLIALGILLFLLVPRLFGFKAARIVTPQRTPRRLPVWFWVGLVVNLASWAMMWFGSGPLVKYAFTPLWWGFILAVDGLVYARTGGKSMLVTEPKQMVMCIIVSVVGWYAFEFLNYVVLLNWIYPNWMALVSHTEAVILYTLAFTTVWPAIFEIYTLLRTFPGLVRRWANGPSIEAPPWALWLILLVGSVLAVLVGVYHYLLFFGVWLCSLLVMPPVLGLLGYWTPFKEIQRGNWSPVVVVALAGFCNAVMWEMWNFGSELFNPGTNPNFWQYSIPYLDVIHIFSEMPILGYFGYLPFGVAAAIWWLLGAHLFNFNPDFDPERHGVIGTAETSD